MKAKPLRERCQPTVVLTLFPWACPMKQVRPGSPSSERDIVGDPNERNQQRREEEREILLK